MDVKTFAQTRGITASVQMLHGGNVRTDKQGWDHFAYRIKLRRRLADGTRVGMAVPLRVGIGWEREPDVRDALEAVSNDVATALNAESFEDFCAEHGMDDDSRWAERVYKACQRSLRKTREFLGSDEEVQALVDTLGE